MAKWISQTISLHSLILTLGVLELLRLLKINDQTILGTVLQDIENDTDYENFDRTTNKQKLETNESKVSGRSSPLMRNEAIDLDDETEKDYMKQLLYVFVVYIVVFQ